MTTNDLPTPERVDELVRVHEAILIHLKTSGYLTEFHVGNISDTIACLRELQRSMMSHINWRSIETDPPSRDTIKSDKLLVCDNFGNVCANHWSDYRGLQFWAEDTDDARGAILFWAEYPSPPAIESDSQSTPSPP